MSASTKKQWLSAAHATQELSSVMSHTKGHTKPSGAPKIKAPSKAEVMRSYGMPEKWGTSYLRYTNPIEKGIFWYYFSLYVRERDVKKWGTCISCLRPISVDTSEAGHFMPAASCGPELLFDELNVNAECSRCNAWDETHLLSYAEELDRRYGVGTASRLRARRAEYKNSPVPVKDYKQHEYKMRLDSLLEKMGVDVPAIHSVAL